MELTWTGVLLLLCVLFTLFSSFQMYKKKGQLPPGPAPWPILGNLFQQDVLPLYKSYKKLIGRYGPIFTIWVGSKPLVVLCGHKIIKDALINHAEEFSGRNVVPTIERIFHNHGLATADEKIWKEMRHFMLSTLRNFGMGKKQMSERVQEEALCLVEELGSMQGQPFEPKRICTSAVSNVICAVVFGNRFDYKDQTFVENQKTVESLLKLCSNFTGMEQNSSMIIYTPEKLVRFVLEMFFAGTVSTSNVLVSSLLVVAKLPHIQAKVQQEIAEVVGTSHIPSMEDRLRMPFTNAVIHEVQRCWIDSLETFPRATTCDITFHGYSIPKYMAVVAVLPSVHFDPLQWETPEKFNPNHFLDEKGQFRKRDAFMAFSAGKRSCPGEALARMELFLFFSVLLQKFTFYLDVDTKDMDVISLIMDFKNNKSPPLRAIKR
ncbi:PREDICTED: cytochrome P450 2G1-like [Thamnophis sirtalis]|uniref:Cytochrome P450 2G1-like n=1 Tax=Thamnophis sirtalis TaxID=35019 RepID=A0A6I9XK00_9SAUR|nr:PREDICTED: cytochrome P450 2G1-like [Thamnophis sirtalis]XP_013911221.1 PREDICTED: cytochrome P450 2G1-like [Thamnophis sirtalis]XP_013911229.1 PREDICTED: cytochrome P450 2G1-like [Thamnophis sirtalis]XP_013911236.1 PREDICTED: cytochrome P450 2G1-like [Thamnophis sirtalis]XP_013911244.1 PREDICTED: cytochrome P450 2G1-like [Thamnophis sirtalis]